ncbi:hypothetical protein IWQ47_003544 [Aquimarina sp. EL_43]|uniref:hypothetical protein n=1 Tax=unclassified Aquimarina TaxID=2627091 RepID=UPI0018CBD9AA|nr:MULTISPECIES: hypothetical protein [unclassified Aquimarina]MBG6132484.1 hypothetical protein [Aquimarina sp. EL_35]MBG6152615.1 hypothetical protein [Aquimarina sp. EL_32]MBG6170458.1 hypothetical protein [Aquimarina sp. EL_43]
MKTKTLLPRVFTEKDTLIEPTINADSYFQKVIKYIPGEIIAFYLVFNKFAIEEGKTGFLVLFFIGLILTPFYKYFGLKDQSKTLNTPWFQIIISIIAFTIWVFALGDFNEIQIINYNPFYASLILATFTLTTPILEQIFEFKKK